MELIKGYKQTEMGVFPEEWEILPFKSISSMHGRIGWQGLKQSEFNMQPDDPFLITGMNFFEGEIRWDEVYHIPKNRYKEAKQIQLKIGDVLMTKDGTIGKILYVDQIPYPGKASLNSHLLVFRPLNNKYLPKFLFYQLNSESFHNHIELEKSGTTFFGITQEAVGKYNVILPPLPEQRLIASALSDVDSLITSLDKLITKKRLIKQGAMQQLLTGKTHLPGFSAEWAMKSILELADMKKERFDDGDWIEAEFLTDNGIRLVQTGNIGEGYFIERESRKYISSDSFMKLRCKEVFPGDILICRLAEPAGRACIMPDISEEKVITAVDVSIFRPLEALADRRYLVHIFCTDIWFSDVSERCGGTTRTRIARSELGKIEVRLPSLCEQQAIADVLSEMDAEIAALEQRRDKIRLLKQGMMQELLTGRIRLT